MLQLHAAHHMDNNLLYLFNYNSAPDHGTVFMQQAMLCVLQQDCKSRVDHLVVIPSKSGEGAFMIPRASGENGISPAAEPLYSMQELCPEPGRKKDCSSLQHPGAGQLRARGQRQHCGREGAGNAAQSAEL